MGSRIREDKGRVRGLRVKVRNEGWVPACARIRNVCGDYGCGWDEKSAPTRDAQWGRRRPEGKMGSRIRGNNGSGDEDGFPHTRGWVRDGYGEAT